MADIKSYLKEKEKREQNQEHYKVKILKHRLSSFYRILLVLIAIGALVTLVVIQYKNHIYTGYDEVSSAPRVIASGSTDVRLGDAILTYSKDGAHCTDLKGNDLWNQTYGIQDILLSTCQDVAAIGEYNGRNIYVMSKDKQLTQFTANMPIRGLSVAATGRVAVVMVDSKLTWIHIFDGDGKQRYEGKASMESSGYPAAVSLSPNGELLQVAYIYLDAGVQKTNIAFYNYGPVGENQPDRLMSVYTYSDVMVPYVQFMNDDTAFAVGDNRLMIYKGSQKPVVAAEYLCQSEIISVVYSDRYIGLVSRSDTSDARYRIEVYNADGEVVGKYYFDMDYTDIFFEQDSFTIYNESECMIMTMDGVVKYQGPFHKNVRLMIPAKGSYKYAIVTPESIDTIQLK